MAIRNTGIANYLASSKFGSNRENEESAVIAKNVSVKPTSQRAPQRLALGDIGNKVPSNVDGVKKDKNDKKLQPARSDSTKPSDFAKPRPVLSKAKTTVLASITELPLPKREPSPAPMDVSDAKLEDFGFSSQLLKVDDIDKNDSHNPQLVSEYVTDIYEYMRQLEREFRVNSLYLDSQQITPRMRGILIDWLVQVHLRFHLLQETLFLTVAIIDRFLQVQEVSRNKLQLVGVSSMFIASKYEEMYAPEIGDFVYITDNAYTKADIRKMECMILRTLDFHLGKPLPLHFLRRNSKAAYIDATRHTLAKYFMELSLPDYDFVQYDPSLLAAAALFLSMRIMDNKAKWTDTLIFYSKYNENDLLPCVKKLAFLLKKCDTAKLQAVRTKYSSSKFLKITSLPELQSSIISEFADSSSKS